MNASITTPLTAMNPPPAASKGGAVASAVPKKSKAKWFILVGILLLAGLGAAAYYKNKFTDKGLAVTTEKAVVKTITQIVTATGKVQPEVEVKISPEVA